jgi:hypothetical protein
MRRAVRLGGALPVLSSVLSPLQQHLGCQGLRAASTAAPITATLFPGDGIGPEIAEAVKKIFTAAGMGRREGCGLLICGIGNFWSFLTCGSCFSVTLV